MDWQYVVVAVVGYLMGAIPSGWLVAKLTRGIDIREYGSGATGTANVLRSLGLRPALLVLLADILKVYVTAVSSTMSVQSKVTGDCTTALSAGETRSGVWGGVVSIWRVQAAVVVVFPIKSVAMTRQE